MPFGLKDKDVECIKNVLKQITKIDEAIIFGSRAMGTERLGSDIDIALKGNGITQVDINKLNIKLDGQPIAYDFDFIIYNQIKTPELTKHIDENGITFYTKEKLPSEWKTYKLSELVEIKYGKDHKHLADGEIPLYGSGGIMRYVDTPLYEKESILIPRKGTLSNLFYLNIPFWSVDTMFYTKIKEGNNGKYLYYLLKSMDLASMNVGSAVPSLTTEVLNKVEINVPDEATQIEIAQILTSLDDKIELNLQMNQTLVAMAQALFKEWFVNFNFPNFDGELENGLPNGWRMGKLNEVAKIEIGRTPPRLEEEWFSKDEKDNKWISIRDMGQSGIYIFNTSEYLTNEAIEKFRIPVIPENTVVLSFKLTIGRLAITTEKMLSNEAIAQINSTEFPPEYIYLYLKTYNWGSLGSTSSIATAVNSKTIKEMEILIPDTDISNLFKEVIRPIFEKIKYNSLQIQTLTQTRDTLLPKLMNGKIEIKN